jgi:hypothetical protein
MTLKVAFLTNISQSAITIDSLTGAVDKNDSLRPYQDKNEPQYQNKEQPVNIILEPGTTLAIPLRINFVLPPRYIDEISTDKHSTNKTYESIRQLHSDYVDGKVCINSETGFSRKAHLLRDSFGPPVALRGRVYSYGEAIDPKRVSVGGAQIQLSDLKGNSFSIVAQSTYGSCPYLYAIDAGEREWVRHGKLIDNASSPAKEMTQRLELPGAVTRFKISEEELELTFVHKVRLELALADGRTISLKPRNRLRPETADHYDKIKYGAEHEYRFDIPVGLDPGNVLKSTLAVTGYYLRYSDAAAIDNQSEK